MIECGGVFLPDGETHLVEWMTKRNDWADGKLAYQLHKLEAAMEHVKDWRVAVDVGAHCGLWSMHLVKRFGATFAFEPIADHRECFRQNVLPGLWNAKGGSAHDERSWVVLVETALGEADGTCKMKTEPSSSGDSYPDPENGSTGVTRVARFDDLKIFDDAQIDFVKLDCEGYELFALRGMEQTLKRSHPCVIVEQKPCKAQKYGLGETDAVAYLESLGAVLRDEISGDYILNWD